MKTETEAVWAERVEEWRKSGKTATEFAADKPYAGTTLQWAASRLRHGGRRRRRAGAGDIALAQVVRRPRVVGSVAEVVVEVGGARIAVRRGFDATLLSSVVQTLKEER